MLTRAFCQCPSGYFHFESLEVSLPNLIGLAGLKGFVVLINEANACFEKQEPYSDYSKNMGMQTPLNLIFFLNRK